MLESLFNEIAGLTPILKNICQTLLLHCTHTTHWYLSVLLYIQHIFPHHHCYYSEAFVWRCSIKKGVLRNFPKLTGKHLCQSLFFNKVAGLRPASLLKKRRWHRCVLVNFAKHLGTRFFKEHLRWLLLAFDNISDVCFSFKSKMLERI